MSNINLRLLLMECHKSISDSLDVTGGCDHQVGICECNDRDLLKTITQVLDDKEFDGFIRDVAFTADSKMLRALIALDDANDSTFLCLTTGLSEHPESYDGPCACKACQDLYDSKEDSK